MSKNNTNAVSNLLVWAREQGMIPWDYVVDETREAERVSSWDYPDQIIEAAVNGSRRNHWQDQPGWIEVWSEKWRGQGMKTSAISGLPAELQVAVKRAAHELSHRAYESHRTALAAMASDRLKAGADPVAVLTELLRLTVGRRPFIALYHLSGMQMMWSVIARAGNRRNSSWRRWKSEWRRAVWRCIRRRPA